MKVLKVIGLTAVALIASVALLATVGSAFLFWVFQSGTTTTVYERATSPDGRREARVQFSDCGAACSFQRLVVVEGRGGQPTCNVFQVHGEWPVKIQWLDASTLLVRNPAPPEELRHVDTRCGAVAIRVIPPPASGAPPSAD